MISYRVKKPVVVRENYVPHKPTERQNLFLVDLKDELEAFYGGQLGGGKSDSLLMASLEYVHVPNYAAILLRRTYQDLSKPGALMDRAREWLSPFIARKVVSWNEQKKQYRFPNDAVLTFGYLENENDKLQYQSAEFQFVGFDELTQFNESQYTYLFTRLRRPAIPCDNCLQPLKKERGIWQHANNELGCVRLRPNPISVARNGALYDVPLRMRSGSNPAEDLRGYWVAERFVPDDFTPEDAIEPKIIWKESADKTKRSGGKVRRAFVPSRLEDNPFVDRQAYDASLDELDDVTFAQLRTGDWRIKRRGNIFPMWREDFHVISWSQFERVYGVRGVPYNWHCGISQDWGSTKSHPCVTTLFTTSSANSALPGKIFIPWGLTLYEAQNAQQVARDYLKPALEKLKVLDRIDRWLMSHEAKSERNSYAEMDLPFEPWGLDACGGLDQVRRHLEIRNKRFPNPFGKVDIEGNILFGCPSLMLVVNDEQLIRAKNDDGLARHRGELASYSWYVPKVGEPPEKLRPQKLFNDAADTIRCYAEQEFPEIEPLTAMERATSYVDERLGAVEQVSPDVRVYAQMSRDLHIQERLQEEQKGEQSWLQKLDGWIDS